MIFDVQQIRYLVVLCTTILYLSCDQKETTVQESGAINHPIEKFLQQADDKTKTVAERKRYLDSAYAICQTLEDNKYKRKKIYLPLKNQVQKTPSHRDWRCKNASAKSENFLRATCFREVMK